MPCMTRGVRMTSKQIRSERKHACDGYDRLLNIRPNRMRAERAGQYQDER